MENTEKIYETITVKCERCGNEFPMYPAEQKFFDNHGLVYPKRCPECRNLRKNVTKIKCIDCNKEFDLNDIQKEYFEKNNLSIPKRCPECREIKKIRDNK